MKRKEFIIGGLVLWLVYGLLTPSNTQSVTDDLAGYGSSILGGIMPWLLANIGYIMLGVGIIVVGLLAFKN